MKIPILIHDDWEIYGDGTGNPEELMFTPARQILQACSRVGAKYTFFAEIGQQWAMKASASAVHQRWARDWEQLLTEAVQAGHDVQLHLHPQWLGAQAQGDRFMLDYSKWSIARLEKSFISPILKQAKDYLLQLLKPFNADYDVVAFRAGSYMIQPSESIVQSLKENGILADVTVIKGMVLNSAKMGSIDFTDAPSHLFPWFPDQGNILKSSSHYDRFFCLPTASTMTSLPLPAFAARRNPLSLKYHWAQRKFAREKAYTPVYASENGSAPQSKSRLGSLVKRVFKSHPVMLDYGQMHSSTIIHLVKKFEEEAAKSEFGMVPLILYSHAKQFFSIRNFETLLEKLTQKFDIDFQTTRAVVRQLDQRFSLAMK